MLRETEERVSGRQHNRRKAVDIFYTSRRRHTNYWRDWSSDVCSSDLCAPAAVSQPIRSMASRKLPLTPPYVSISRKRRFWRRSSSRLQKAATLPSLRMSTWSQHSSTSRRSEERRVGKECRTWGVPV